MASLDQIEVAHLKNLKRQHAIWKQAM